MGERHGSLTHSGGNTVFNIIIHTAPNVLATTGLTQTQFDKVIQGINQAVELWGRYIDSPNANIDLALDFTDLSGNTLAEAGANFFSFGGGVFLSEVEEELNERPDSGGVLSYGNIDANMTIDLPRLLANEFFFSDDVSFNDNPGAPGQIDFLTLITHELGHSLGFLGLSFDGFVSNNQFIGANAIAANGGPVQLADGVHILGNDLMSPSISNNQREFINPVHIAMLKDIGVPIAEASANADVLYGYHLNDDTLDGLDGDDRLFGLSGDDNISGSDGNDYLDGGLGSDTLNGGIGDDTIVYDAADTYANVQGGAGFDTLWFEAVRVSVDLLANGFEQAALHIVDTASELFDEIFEYYNTFEELKSRETRFDDGTSQITTFDLDDSFNWQQRDQFFDANGVLTNETFIFDSLPVINGTVNNDTIINATDVAEEINGLEGNDYIDAKGGDDTINGGDGNDAIIGGTGADTIDGGAGLDTVLYDSSATGVTIDLLNNTASGGDAQGDTLTNIEHVRGSNGGDDMLTGDANNNNLFGFAGDDTLDGGEGNDFLSAGVGTDTLLGGIGNDVLVGGAGADVLNGGGGLDTAHYGSSAGGVTINLETGLISGGDATGDTFISIERVYGSNTAADNLTGNNLANLLFGFGGDDNLTGGGGNDYLNGGDGVDTILGGDGNDTVVGGAGADVLNGGAGIDTANYSTSTAGVTASLATGSGTGGDAAGDSLIDIERIYGSATGGDDLTGDNGNNLLFTYGGDDTANGGGGNDLIRGGDGADTLNGDAGNDTLEGGAGADILNGGAGTDVASYARSTTGVTVNLATGVNSGAEAVGDTYIDIERVDGSSTQADNLTGDALDNLLFGLGGADTLNGGDGNDFLNGGLLDDILNGGEGNDVLVGGSGSDTLNGGNGLDTANYSTSAGGININLDTNSVSGGDATGDTLIDIEHIYGSSISADTITGNASNNTLFGFGGVDVLNGLDGNDYLNGGSAADTLNGGEGNDVLVGGTGGDILNGGNGLDTAHYGSSTVGVNVNLATNTVSGGDAQGDTISGIERVYGSNTGGDVLTGDGVANLLFGFGGADTLDGAAGNDYINGGNGDDLITGGLGNDTLIGGAGNDTAIFAGDQSDFTVVDEGGGNFRVTEIASGDFDLLSEIETLRFGDGDVLI